MVTIPGMENINFFAVAGQVVWWLGIALLMALIFGVIGFIYYISAFKIKAQSFKLYGSGKDGHYAVSKPKLQRFKWVNNNTEWRPLFPLFNKNKVEPFDSEYIYPNNRVFAFELNGNFFPGRINITAGEKDLKAEINPVPYHMKNWHISTLKENESEFSEHTFWEDNKYFIMGVVTVLICCITAGVTVWLTYKFSGSGVETTQALTNAINGLRAGVAPG